MINAWTVTLTLFAIDTAATYYYLKSVYSFFDNAWIPSVSSVPVLSRLWKVFEQKESFAKVIQQVYNVHSETKYVDFFDLFMPTIMIRDLELVIYHSEEFLAFPGPRPASGLIGTLVQ